MRLVPATLEKIQDATRRSELETFLAQIEATPKDCLVRGMFVNYACDALVAKRVEGAPPRVPGFANVPLRDYMQLLLDTCNTLYPTRSFAEGLRLSGQGAIEVLGGSIAGRVLLGVVGRDWALALRSLSKGYDLTLTPGSAEVVNETDTSALVRLRQVYNFPESYQLGVLEGLMSWCSIDGSVTATTTGAGDCDLQLEWQSGRQ